MSMTLKTTKNLCFGLSVVFKITTRRSTIDVRKKSDLSRKNRTTGPPGHVRKISDQPQPGQGLRQLFPKIGMTIENNILEVFGRGICLPHSPNWRYRQNYDVNKWQM